MIFPSREVRLIYQWFPGSSFLPLKVGMMLPFFQSQETSHDCHDFSNIFESIVVNLLLRSHLHVLVQTFSPCLSLWCFLSCTWLSVQVILSNLVLSFHLLLSPVCIFSHTLFPSMLTVLLRNFARERLLFGLLNRKNEVLTGFCNTNLQVLEKLLVYHFCYLVTVRKSEGRIWKYCLTHK